MKIIAALLSLLFLSACVVAPARPVVYSVPYYEPVAPLVVPYHGGYGWRHHGYWR